MKMAKTACLYIKVKGSIPIAAIHIFSQNKGYLTPYVTYIFVTFFNKVNIFENFLKYPHYY